MLRTKNAVLAGLLILSLVVGDSIAMAGAAVVVPAAEVAATVVEVVAVEPDRVVAEDAVRLVPVAVEIEVVQLGLVKVVHATVRPVLASPAHATEIETIVVHSKLHDRGEKATAVTVLAELPIEMVAGIAAQVATTTHTHETGEAGAAKVAGIVDDVAGVVTDVETTGAIAVTAVTTHTPAIGDMERPAVFPAMTILA